MRTYGTYSHSINRRDVGYAEHGTGAASNRININDHNSYRGFASKARDRRTIKRADRRAGRAEAAAQEVS